MNLLKGQEWEPLMDTKDDDGEIVKIYLSKNGERSTNVILAVSDEDANLVVINGTFDFAKMMQEGMKVKTEVNDTKVEINNKRYYCHWHCCSAWAVRSDRLLRN